MTMRLSSLLRFLSLKPSLASSSSSSHHHHLSNYGFVVYLHFSTTTTTSQTISSSPHFMVDYLTNTVGLPRDRAIVTSSKYFARLTTPEQPDSVLRFLRESILLADARIRAIISWYPTLLLCNVEKSLQPRLAALKEAGFSTAVLANILHRSPTLLVCRNLFPKLAFWRRLVGGDEKKLITLLKRNRNLLSYDMDVRIVPNITFLASLGFSSRDVLKISTKANSFVLQTRSSMESLIERTEELGLSRGSGMFVHGLAVVTTLTAATLKKRFEVFKSLGWSEAELLSVFRKFPSVFTLSEKTVRAKMSFWVKEVGCRPSEVALQPILLGFSLEKRLIPRYHIVKILKNMGIKDYQLTKIMHLTDKQFAEKCILPHREEVPDLHKAFIADCAGSMNLLSHWKQ